MTDHHRVADVLSGDIATLGRDIDAERVAAITRGIAAMLGRLGCSYDGVLAEGSESVVVAGTRAGRGVVVKATADPADVADEAALFDTVACTPDVIDVDVDTGIVAMTRIDGALLNSMPIVDPAGEWARLRELVDAINSAALDASHLSGFRARIDSRAHTFRQVCRNAGRDDLLVHLDRALDRNDVTDGRWVALDLYPKNVIVDGNGAWWLIDPMPTCHHDRWYGAKWAVCRRNPGTTAGSSTAIWERFDIDPADVLDAMVWETGSQRRPDVQTLLLGRLDELAGRYAMAG
jgi:hypothetical protein